MLPNDMLLFDTSICIKKRHNLLYRSFLIVLPVYSGCFTHKYDLKPYDRHIGE